MMHVIFHEPPRGGANLLLKNPSVLLAQHKTRGVFCRKTSKEGQAEKSGMVLYVVAAQLYVRNTANFREPSPSRTGKKYLEML